MIEDMMLPVNIWEMFQANMNPKPKYHKVYNRFPQSFQKEFAKFLGHDHLPQITITQTSDAS
jgi:hypothetical protein